MTYDFEIDGVTYSVPAFKDLPAGALRKARTGTDDMDRAFIILEQTLGEDSDVIHAIDTLTVTELGEWLTGWTKGAPLGESSSSEN
jgi:hypothetical protein